MTKKKRERAEEIKPNPFRLGFPERRTFSFGRRFGDFLLSLSLSLFCFSIFESLCLFLCLPVSPIYLFFYLACGVSLKRDAGHKFHCLVLPFFFEKKIALSLFRLVDGPFRDVVNCRHFFCWRLCFVLFWCLNRPFRWLFRFPMALCFFFAIGFCSSFEIL